MGRAPWQAGVGTERNRFYNSRKMLFVSKRQREGADRGRERERVMGEREQ